MQAQALLWGWVVTLGSDTFTAPAWATGRAAQLASVPVGLVLPIPAIVILAVAAALQQVHYLDRLAIRVGR